jgi:glutathione S-transferase
MKLHWSPRSPFVRKVMIAARELAVVDRIRTIRSVATMTQPNPAIMADNPLSKIPTLVLDDGTVIVDSAVIVEYLDAMSGNRLIPAAGPERWVALSRQALGDGFLDLLVLWRSERTKPADKQTAALCDAFQVKVTATLDRFETLAGELAAGPFGIAQITIGCALSYADFRFDDLQWRDGRPALAAWHGEFAARPSMVATEIVDD